MFKFLKWYLLIGIISTIWYNAEDALCDVTITELVQDYDERIVCGGVFLALVAISVVVMPFFLPLLLFAKLKKSVVGDKQ